MFAITHVISFSPATATAVQMDCKRLVRKFVLVGSHSSTTHSESEAVAGPSDAGRMVGAGGSPPSVSAIDAECTEDCTVAAAETVCPTTSPDPCSSSQGIENVETPKRLSQR